MSLQYVEELSSRDRSHGAVWAVSWTPSGVIAAHDAGAVTAWDATTGEQLSAAKSPHALGVVALTTSSDGATSVTNAVDGSTALWKWGVADGTKPHLALAQTSASLKQQGVGGAPFGIEAWTTALSPKGDVFAATGERLQVCTFSADAASFGEGVKRYEARGTDPAAHGLRLAFNADASLLAVGTSTGDVVLFDVETSMQVAVICDHAQPVRALYFPSPNSTFADHLLVGSDDRVATLHDVQDVREAHACSTVAALQGHQGWVLDVHSSGDGRIVATCSSDHTIRLWDLAATPKACVCVIEDAAPVWCVCWKPQDAAPPTELPSTRLLLPGSALVFGSENGALHWYRNAGASAPPPEEV